MTTVEILCHCNNHNTVDVAKFRNTLENLTDDEKERAGICHVEWEEAITCYRVYTYKVRFKDTVHYLDSLFKGQPVTVRVPNIKSPCGNNNDNIHQLVVSVANSDHGFDVDVLMEEGIVDETRFINTEFSALVRFVTRESENLMEIYCPREEVIPISTILYNLYGDKILIHSITEPGMTIALLALRTNYA